MGSEFESHFDHEKNVNLWNINFYESLWASGSFTKDSKNLENIFKVDDTHDEEQDTIGKENIAGGNTVTAHTERDTNESILDHENDDLNSSFTEVLNDKEEKKESCLWP